MQCGDPHLHGSPVCQRHCGALSAVFSGHISAVERSFRARIGASGPCTCCLHSYKASGCLRCNVSTLISRPGLLSVRDTVEALCKCFLTISQQSSGLFEHGLVRRDRARASYTATRLVAGRGHLLICGHGHLFDGDTVESLHECFQSIFQQWCCLFEHGSVRQDQAHAVGIATRV